MPQWKVEINEPNGWGGGQRPSGVVVTVRASDAAEVPAKVREWMQKRGYSQNLTVGRIERVADKRPKPVH